MVRESTVATIRLNSSVFIKPRKELVGPLSRFSKQKKYWGYPFRVQNLGLRDDVPRCSGSIILVQEDNLVIA